MELKKGDFMRYSSAGMLVAGITPNILSALMLQNPFYLHIGLLFTVLALPAFISTLYYKNPKEKNSNLYKQVMYSNDIR